MTFFHWSFILEIISKSWKPFLHLCPMFAGASTLSIFFLQYHLLVLIRVIDPISKTLWTIDLMHRFPPWNHISAPRFPHQRFYTINLCRAISWLLISRLWDVGCKMSSIHFWISEKLFPQIPFRNFLSVPSICFSITNFIYPIFPDYGMRDV